MMLGSYSQNALSGAATVNQIFFVINQLAIALGSALIVMGSQYWGKGDTGVIRKLTGIALVFSMLAAVLILAICAAVDRIIYNIFGNYRRRAGVSWHIKMDVCAVFDQ